MINESNKLAICFSGDMIRFIEAEDWHGTMNVTNVARTPVPKKFDFSIIGDHDYVPQIAGLIDATLENFSTSLASARVCIDRRLALRKNFAVDKGLTDDEIRRHIEWELEQVLIAPRDEYNVDYLFNELYNSKKDVVVFAAVRTAIVKYLREIFQKTKVSLETIDLDLFASARILNNVYSDELAGASALVDFNQSGIGVTYFLNGVYTLSADLPTVVDDKRFDAWTTDMVSSQIDKVLQHLTENVEENFCVADLQRIYLAGPLPHSSLVDELTKARPAADIKIMEPFENIHKQLNIESQMLIDEQGEEFIACLGMVV